MKTAEFPAVLTRTQKLLRHSSLSKALLSSSNPNQLHKLHSLLITLGLHKSVFFSGNLISKYAFFKDHVSSLSVFRRVSPTANVYLWNSIIRALTHCGLFSEALEFYSNMRGMKLKPDTYTFPSVINACAGSLDFEMGGVVRDHVRELGFGFDLYIGNALVDMYARFGDLVSARGVFEEMPQRDVVSWNSLISGYSANGYWGEALEVYYQSQMDGLKPDYFTISSVLPACGGLVAVKEGEVIHGLVEKMGINTDVLICNGLLSMYVKFDRLMDAGKVFDRMMVKDSVSWNTMICGYSLMQLFEESIKLFMEMVTEFRPDLLTITSVLRACGHLKDLEFGKFVHDYMIKSDFECDITANNILIDMYAKCGDMMASRAVFETMKCSDLVSWNSLINGYIQGGNYDEGVKIFKMMKMRFVPDSFTYGALLSVSTQLAKIDLGKELHCDIAKLGFDSDLVVGNALVNMYAKCRKIDDSLKVFGNMKVRDIVTWNTIIAASIEADDCSLGFSLINRMVTEEMVPNIATMLSILPLCSILAARRQGKEIHAYIFKLGFESDVPIGNALIEMYSKCGNLKNSVRVFKQMKIKDVVTWTALIYAYGMYGEGLEAIKAFEEMEASGLVPDHIAFVAIIYACSHSGLVEEGLAYFYRINKDYSIEPSMEHYACVVDLLSRSGLLSNAEEFIHSMELKPDASVWGSLLSACRASGETEIAERVSQHIIQLDLEDAGYYVLASNVYATLEKWDRVKMMRKFIKAKGLKKEPGSSWIEIRNKVYAFGTWSWNNLFEQYQEVIELLEILSGLMAKEGYTSELQYALHDVDDDEKRDFLCGHSERLAIAFGLLNSKPGSPLQVMKNLRVCGDCHTWTKYVSKVVQREILVRDANRFHLFKNGTCSCGDHW